MSTLKDVLCLLAILVAYGIAGRMDYDDAVMHEKAQQASAAADCSAGITLSVNKPEVQTSGLAFNPQADGADIAAPVGDAFCASQAF
jgi:hypothetical protein